MLVSGSGTILDAVTTSGVPVRVVVADRPCPALALAVSRGIEALLIDRRDFGGFTPGFQRARYTEALTDALVARGVDVVAMAGFGTVLTERVHDAFDGRILNTHPSLLPAFPGWHAVADALAAGVTTTGCTVHVATPEVDAGPVLAQEEVPVLPGDTESTLHERIKRVERRLYPATILRVLGELDAAPATVRPARASSPVSQGGRP
ncbi:MAG: phosphoribosylglycinamide formyltransferase [Actinomycetota bacterium]|nr:phosphoribosylglycinamide formyltransferase [Actinomycetota bacterium]MDA8317516.1 phosphoribosylglycinamide formyltransferase [Actinomycetota bacterium]